MDSYGITGLLSAIASDNVCAISELLMIWTVYNATYDRVKRGPIFYVSGLYNYGNFVV